MVVVLRAVIPAPFASMSKWKEGIVNVAEKLVRGKSATSKVMFLEVAGLKSTVKRVPLRRTTSSLSFTSKMLLMVMLFPT